MITESIFDGTTVVVPMAEVQHIVKTILARNALPAIQIITSHTKYNREVDDWENPIFLQGDEAAEFMKAWCNYRREKEESDGD